MRKAFKKIDQYSIYHDNSEEVKEALLELINYHPSVPEPHVSSMVVGYYSFEWLFDGDWVRVDFKHEIETTCCVNDYTFKIEYNKKSLSVILEALCNN